MIRLKANYYCQCGHRRDHHWGNKNRYGDGRCYYDGTSNCKCKGFAPVDNLEYLEKKYEGKK